jgi:hypothetical protein
MLTTLPDSIRRELVAFSSSRQPVRSDHSLSVEHLAALEGHQYRTRVLTLTGNAPMRSRTASDNCRSTSMTR